MNKDNSKVPVAILSCFLIAFILQGALKLGGVFVFEKALNWEIFTIIDNSLFLNIWFNGLLVVLTCYCLSFSLTAKPYSKKWWHYLIILIASFGVVSIRIILKPSFTIHTLLDIFVYIIVPTIINLTSKRKQDITQIITMISLQILLYFCYLGLSFWSNVLNGLIPRLSIFTKSMQMFLIKFEVYIGLFLLMFSLNLVIKKMEEKK